MRKEFNSMLIMVVCAIIGIILTALATTLYNQGYISTMIISSGMTLSQMQFLIFGACLFIGVVMGAVKS